jgi:hypothetical protein
MLSTGQTRCLLATAAAGLLTKLRGAAPRYVSSPSSLYRPRGAIQGHADTRRANNTRNIRLKRGGVWHQSVHTQKMNSPSAAYELNTVPGSHKQPQTAQGARSAARNEGRDARPAQQLSPRLPLPTRARFSTHFRKTYHIYIQFYSTTPPPPETAEVNKPQFPAITTEFIACYINSVLPSDVFLFVLLLPPQRAGSTGSVS